MTDASSDPHTIRARFFEALGSCINEWAYVEQSVFLLFQSALKTDQDLAAAIFWSFPSISMRMSYTRTVVDLCLRPKTTKALGPLTRVEKEFKSICSDFTKLLEFRNDIAHQPRASTTKRSVVMQMGKGIVDDGGGFDMIIYPNERDTKKKFEPIRTEHMEQNLETVKALNKRLEIFRQDFEKERKR